MQDGAVVIHLKPFKTEPKSLAGIVVLRDRRGEESLLAIDADAWRRAGRPAALPLAEALLFAVLGGFILNLMPCVFPILAMKAMGLARLSGSERRVVRWHAVVLHGGRGRWPSPGSAARCWRCAARAARSGWGFQFQSPIAVTLLAWVLFVVGLNLSGVFAVGGRLSGVGPGARRRAAATPAASAPACWRCWSPRPARRRSWAPRSPPRWPRRRR